MPILKEKVWGGDILSKSYGKAKGKQIGESWEISGVKDSVSIVSNGKLKGTSLDNLLSQYAEEILGPKVFAKFGDQFPLLFKFIDAKEDLSVQLHPDDALAKTRHGSSGKTEMWYILEAKENARLILGFNQKMTKQLYSKHLSENSMLDILHSEEVKKGDAFFIAPGTVHAIGAGIVLAEIQQTSDITYRIYDWDRPGTDGELRELHTDLAFDAINYKNVDPKCIVSEEKNKANFVCNSRYFETNRLELTKSITRSIENIDSFVVYMCVEGTAVLTSEANKETLQKGDTILIPSSFSEVHLDTENACLLEVYIR